MIEDMWHIDVQASAIYIKRITPDDQPNELIAIIPVTDDNFTTMVTAITHLASVHNEVVGRTRRK